METNKEDDRWIIWNGNELIQILWWVLYILVKLKRLQLTGHIQGIKSMAILDSTFGGQRRVSTSSKTLEDGPSGRKTLKKSNGYTIVERLYSGGQRLAIRMLRQRRRRWRRRKDEEEEDECVALLGGCGRYVFLVGQIEVKTQLLQCFYNCAVKYFIVDLLWLFNNAASLLETDNR
jgi:hypothetical protein